MLNLSEAAAYLGMSPSGLRKILNRGQIKYFQHGKHGRIKFKQEWLDDYIEAHAVSPVRPLVTSPVSKKRRRATSTHRPPDDDQGLPWHLMQA